MSMFMPLRLALMLVTGIVLGYALASQTLEDAYKWKHSVTDAARVEAIMREVEAQMRARGYGAPATSVDDMMARSTFSDGSTSTSGADERLRVDARGHVETYVEADGADMRVMIDTGASLFILRESDARRAGYRVSPGDFTVEVNTANGTSFAAPIVMRSVELGSIRVRNVQALVKRDDQLHVNLLGMSFLNQLRSFQFENGYLLLEN